VTDVLIKKIINNPDIYRKLVVYSKFMKRNTNANVFNCTIQLQALHMEHSSASEEAHRLLSEHFVLNKVST